MTITPTTTWERAMRRALREGLKATRRVDGTYRVRSVSRPGTVHVVTLDAAGHIVHCTDCKGWENGGRRRPCKHAGAVALARAFELGASFTTAAVTIDPVMMPSRPSKGRVFRAER